MEGYQSVWMIEPAKSEALARIKVAGQCSVVDWDFMREMALPPQSPAKVTSEKRHPMPAPLAKPVVVKATKLDKLLYLQNGECFFCGCVLTKAEASIEHLLAKSKGGSDADGNGVACCVTLTRTFGNMELKGKVRLGLERKRNFECP